MMVTAIRSSLARYNLVPVRSVRYNGTIHDFMLLNPIANTKHDDMAGSGR
jgi:hypothetical protein